MNDTSPPQKNYRRGVAHGDIKCATKIKPIRITLYEFVTRYFDAYLDDEGRYYENLVAEYPHSDSGFAS